MTTISLSIFNEDFWHKGLIYSQNIKPLLRIVKKHKDYEIEFLSFISIIKYFRQRKDILLSLDEMRRNGIRCHLLPILFYPTKYMVVKWFLLPWFIINMFPYLIWISFRDIINKGNIYVLRSYQISLAFLLLYKGKGKCIFDTRTDWIEEARGMCYWEKDDLTDKMWLSFEKKMLTKFQRTIFISEEQKKDVLLRSELDSCNKFVTFYNQTDFSRYVFLPKERNEDFIYSGSLGHWNNLTTYLDFFLGVCHIFSKSKLIILTPTAKDKIEPIFSSSKYDVIRDRIIIHYDVSYAEIPYYYGCCKYGLQLMEKSDSRVGVKFVEYIAAGLIPIVHQNVRGAAYIAKKMGLGVVVGNDLDANKLKEIKEYVIDTESYRQFKMMTDEKLSNDQLFKYLSE